MLASTKKGLAIITGIVGFVSAVVGLWPIFFPAVPDQEVLLLPKDTRNIVFNSSNVGSIEGFVKANDIVIDGVSIIAEPNSLLVANSVSLINGAEIVGEDISVISTTISGGKISAEEANTKNGGSILIISALIDDVLIRANGITGNDGLNGSNGVNGSDGENGRNGVCSCCGGWRSPHSGSPGTDGTAGTNGESGEDGGNGGSITVLTSYNLLTQPMANGASGGRAGVGGKGGKGGKGGRGGSGCAGLGGISDKKSDGPDGVDGADGIDGKPGKTGEQGVVSVKLIRFDEVADIIEDNINDQEKILLGIREIQPRKN
ncbi:hypothetical protein [Neptunomonas sp. XY-337]|uniref:hypothetical protein n=1 Tax=Neptunomonas sp. XY-337 TaxID=2561897 RepID=UPI0010AA2225|nr:hypothetical protein [Neptunomonas sp. XY-337]